MRVLIRTDASRDIGTGHVMRCLTLARELRLHGGEVVFCCREHGWNSLESIRTEGFTIVSLPMPDTPATPPRQGSSHVRWLGTDWRSDAEQTLAHLPADAHFDWLVTDHYALDDRWESAMRTRCDRIFAIDDLADRRHDCEILLDQNLHLLQETRYDSLLPPGCTRLFGPHFALLREEFQRTKEKLRIRDGSIERVLIFMGGIDQTNETLKVLRAFRSLGRNNAIADVVVGASNPNREAIREICVETQGLNYYTQVHDMAVLMQNADLAIGAGGTTTWERACLSLPTLCISIAENQRSVSEAGAAFGLLKYVGHFTDVTEFDIAQSLSWCFENPDAMTLMASRAGALVDGRGASRVVRSMLKACHGNSQVALRPASRGDMLLLLEWANDPVVRGNALNSSAIELEDHRWWFREKLGSPATAIFILECEGAPAGQIRFDLENEVARIDFSLAKGYRGRGLGIALLKLGVEKMLSSCGAPLRFQGIVKAANAPSAHAFLATGFKLRESKMIQGFSCLIFEKQVV